MPHYPKHLSAFDYKGAHRYFLTFCTWERARHFTDSRHVAIVSEQFQCASGEESFAVVAYCFMPDHVHLLVAGESDDADLKRFSKLAKQYSGFYFRRSTGLALWQRSGFERSLRSEETTAAVVRWVVANPVRAGLVKAPTEYPFWGSFAYTREALLEFVQMAV